MCMRQCCRIFYLAISASKLSQCTKYECTGVAAFFSWSFLCPNCQSAPNVNAPVFPHFLPGHFCTRIVRVHPIGMCWCCCIFVPGHLHAQIVRVHQCECTCVVTSFTWPFLRSNCHSAPNMNVLVLPHFLVGYFCAQIFRVGLM